MRPSTLAELAARYGVQAPLPTSFGSFDAFMATITAAAGCLRTEADVRRLITEIVEDAADQGVRWIEPSMWPGLLGGRLGSDAAGLDVVLDAGLAAGTATGVGFGLVVAANRGLGADAAEEVARLAVSRVGRGVVGFGIDDDEAAAGPEVFVEAAAIARAGGLPVVPHAGELGTANALLRQLGRTRSGDRASTERHRRLAGLTRQSLSAVREACRELASAAGPSGRERTDEHRTPDVPQGKRGGRGRHRRRWAVPGIRRPAGGRGSEGQCAVPGAAGHPGPA
ncbi:hypothetical protein [Kribbella orskensis]|uniref:hypothetical protein n=1 Tax=Kribbella TaxID=182639 RepID=UPI0034E20E8F